MLSHVCACTCVHVSVAYMVHLCGIWPAGLIDDMAGVERVMQRAEQLKEVNRKARADEEREVCIRARVEVYVVVCTCVHTWMVVCCACPVFLEQVIVISRFVSWG